MLVHDVVHERQGEIWKTRVILLCHNQACSLTAFVGDPAPSFFGPNPSCVC